MENIKSISWPVFSVALVAIWGTVALLGASSATKNADTQYMSTEMSCSDIVAQFSPLHATLREVGTIPYDAETANCYDQAKKLTEALTLRDIKSSILVNTDRSHAVVAVWIEATSGQFLPIDADFEILEIRDGVNIYDVQYYNQNTHEEEK